MKEVIDYTILFGGIALVIATAAYAESRYGLNYWLVVTPLALVAFPLMSRFFKRAKASSSPIRDSSSD